MEKTLSLPTQISVRYPRPTLFLRAALLGLSVLFFTPALYANGATAGAETPWEIVLKYVIPPTLTAATITLTIINIHILRGHKRFDFLSNIDCIMLDNPQLWSIYDTRKNSIIATDPDKLENEKEAFCHYILNNFEAALVGSRFNKRKRAWKRYLISLIVESTEFRKVAMRAQNDYIYNEPFQKIIAQHILAANDIMPLYKRYRDGELSQTQYHIQAYRTLKKLDF